MFGCFVYRNGAGEEIRIISSGTKIDPNDSSSEWEHVSVSLAHRCPTWEEMCEVKEMFWKPLETVIQFHPKATSYVNCHPYCLHMWKKVGVDHELPPEWTLVPKQAISEFSKS